MHGPGCDRRQGLLPLTDACTWHSGGDADRMKRFRGILMWAALLIIAALICLSVTGAFLGAESSGEMFRSVPTAVFWVGFAALLVGGLTAFSKPMRCPGLLGMHLGVLLILAGSMWGSPPAHALRAKLLGWSEPHKGAMQIYVGRSDDRVFTMSDPVSMGNLDFSLKLERFWIEYYPPDEPEWLFHAVAGDPDAPDGIAQQRIYPVDRGKIPIPFSDAHVELLDYVTADESRAGLLASTDDGTAIVPLSTDAPVPVELLSARLKVLQVFRNLRVSRKGEELVAEDSPAPGSNPAVEVELTFADARDPVRTYAFTPAGTIRMGHRLGEGAVLMYLPPSGDRHGRIPTPAVKLRLSRGDRVVTGWMAGGEQSDHERVSLVPHYEDAHAWRKAGAPEIVLQRPFQAVREYKSELVVMRDGEEDLRKIGEVNDPLYYAGYHFFQSGYDSEGHRYTVLTVVRDRGLLMVYVGMALLVAGAVWRFWARPMLRRRRQEMSAWRSS